MCPFLNWLEILLRWYVLKFSVLIILEVFEQLVLLFSIDINLLNELALDQWALFTVFMNHVLVRTQCSSFKYMSKISKKIKTTNLQRIVFRHHDSRIDLTEWTLEVDI